MKLRCLALAIPALWLLAGPHPIGLSAAETATERAWTDFLAAGDPAGAAKRIDAVLKTGVSFDDAVARLRRGRDYSPKVGRGKQQGRIGADHNYLAVVPDSYDPSRSYQVRVQLHGGVGRGEPPDVSRLGVGRLPGSVDEIEVFPTAWATSLWWQASQVDNLERILDRLKRSYNVDENRVYLTGISDGGTGVYFMAFRDTTPWASFLPLNGSMMVLSSPEVGADGEIFPGNAINKPFFIVNGGRDHLYPAHLVQPYVEHLMRLGSDVVFHIKTESDHNTDWWPEERADYETFVDEHPRDPLPDKLTWETERVDRYNRAHWLVIDRLGDAGSQTPLTDSNLLRRGTEYDFGLRLNSNVEHGRRVIDVAAGSNAERIGARTSDLVVEVDGHAVQDARDIVVRMQEWAVGAMVRLTVERAGRRLALEGPFKPAEVEAPPEPIFPRGKPSGRVDLVRRGNVVDASTRGVRGFTLLLSPSKFDFHQPIRVVANGRTVFDGVLQPSVATLLKWAARDNDRTMLFGAELAVDVR
jgi:predicted esterase